MSAWAASSRSSDSLVAKLSSANPPTSITLLPMKTFSAANWAGLCDHLESEGCGLSELSLPRPVPDDIVPRLAGILSRGDCSLRALELGDSATGSATYAGVFSRPNSSLTSLDLCNKRLTDASFLASLSSLETLDLSRNMGLSLPPPGAWPAPPASLDASECGLRESDLRRLSDLASCTSLNLSSNPLLFEGAAEGALHELLRKRLSVNLSGCPLPAAQFRFGAGGFRDIGVRKLDLSGCLPADVDVALLVAAVVRARELLLCDNAKAPVGLVVESLFDAVKRVRGIEGDEVGVKDLDLSGCGLVGEGGGEGGGDGVVQGGVFPFYLEKGVEGLERLRLHNNKLKNASEDQIAELANILPRIPHVDLSGNDLSAAQLLVLLEEFKAPGIACHTLELGGNGVDGRVEESLKEVQEFNENLDIPRDIPENSTPMTIQGGGGTVASGGVVDSADISEMMKMAGWKTGGGGTK